MRLPKSVFDANSSTSAALPVSSPCVVHHCPPASSIHSDLVPSTVLRAFQSFDFPNPDDYEARAPDPIWRPPTIVPGSATEPWITAMRDLTDIWGFLGCVWTRARVLICCRNSLAHNTDIFSSCYRWHAHWAEMDRLEAERDQANRDIDEALGRDHELAEAGADARGEQERARWENISLESWMVPSS